MSTAVQVTSANGIAKVILNKPPVNAFNSADWFTIASTINALGDDADVRVIIIAAEGKGFCAGVDIKELAADNNAILQVNRGNYETFKAIHLNPKPVIVGLHGFVLGGGIGICGAADIIVASHCTYFGVPEIDRGAMGGGAHLQRMFPVQKVRYMYFTGEFIDANEAYRLGAIEKIVAREKVLLTACCIAKTIASKSPAMVRLAKEALTGIEHGNLEDKYRWEQGFTYEAYTTNDSQEARDAFVDKRDASFDAQ